MLFVRKPKPGCKLDLATVRLGVEEKAMFQRAAEARGITLAEFIRDSAHRALAQAA